MYKKNLIFLFLAFLFVSTPLPAPVVAEVVVDLVVAAVEIAEDNAAVIASGITTGLKIAKAVTSRESNTARITSHLNQTTKVSGQNSSKVVADADHVARRMTQLTGESLLESAIKLTPIAYSGHIQANMYNDAYMAQIFDLSPKGLIQYPSKSTQNSCPCPLDFLPQKGLFYAPVFIYNDYSSTQGSFLIRGQPGFRSYAYGLAAGWRQIFGRHLSFTTGLGYTHSNLLWRKDLGNSRWSTLYVAPVITWFTHRVFINFQVLGTFNFFNSHRKFAIPGIKRYADSRYQIYDLLLHGNGGYIIPFSKTLDLQLEGTVNYNTIFMGGYEEFGAGSLNLAVEARTRYLLQPRFIARLVKTFRSKHFYYAPNLYVGWLNTIPLTEDVVTSKHKEVVPDLYFRTRGYRDAKNQIILGAEFFASQCEFLELTANFEWNYLSRISVYNTSVKMNWVF